MAVATGLVVATQAGIAPSGGGLAPVTVPLAAVSPLPSSAPAPQAGLPPAASVGKAMLTAYNAASRDVVYERIISVSRGTVVDETQVWDWPAQPVPGQRALEREVYAWRARASAKVLTLATDNVVAYKYLTRAGSETFQLTMVCYPGGRRSCGWGGRTTPPGTWSRVSFRSWSIASSVAPGGSFNPAMIASEMAIGQWRAVGRARLDGQPAIELSETSKGRDRLLPRPVLLWVNARTYLPIRVMWGPRTAVQEWDFAYLPPTSANLALLRAPIPRGYPRSNPARY